MPISKENQGETIQRGKLFKGGNQFIKGFKRGETIQRRKEIKDGKLFKEIRYVDSKTVEKIQGIKFIDIPK